MPVLHPLVLGFLSLVFLHSISFTSSETDDNPEDFRTVSYGTEETVVTNGGNDDTVVEVTNWNTAVDDEDLLNSNLDGSYIGMNHRSGFFSDCTNAPHFLFFA